MSAVFPKDARKSFLVFDFQSASAAREEKQSPARKTLREVIASSANGIAGSVSTMAA
jgi:hypothetical protein